MIALALSLAALASPLACTTTVAPPPAPTEPVTVFLIDYGRTAGVALPDGQGRLIRYTYGDWNYYALRNTGLGDGLAALFWPTQGTLGRGEMPAPADAGDVARQISVGVEQVHPIVVGRAEVEQLRARLEQEHRQGRRTALVETLGLQFTPHSAPYTYFHNSNHKVAGWLRDLGCQTRGPAFYSRWRVAPDRGENKVANAGSTPDNGAI